MGTITTSVDLPYPIADVFRVATRIPDLPRWLPEVTSAELLDPSLGAGSRVRLKLGPATGGAEITGTVTELAEPSRLAITGSGGPLQVRVQTRLVALGDASTRSRATGLDGALPGADGGGARLITSPYLPAGAGRASGRHASSLCCRTLGRKPRDRHLDQRAMVDHHVQVGPPPVCGHASEQLAALHRVGDHACRRLDVGYRERSLEVEGQRGPALRPPRAPRDRRAG